MIVAWVLVFRQVIVIFINNNKGFIATDEWLNCVVEYEILPLLKEYWFDQ